MDDRIRLEQVLRSGPPCVSIKTFEEDYVLELLREVAAKLGRALWIWSVSGGVQDGVLRDTPPVPNTDKPVEGLIHLATVPDRPLCVTLDLGPHLRDERTLRVARNLLRHFRESGSQLVMLDYGEELPDVLREYASTFTVSLPDEAEISELVRDKLRRVSRERPIQIKITRNSLKTIIRNLRGLTRRQIEQIIAEVATEDRRFDDADVHHVMTRKRQTLHRGSLLEYIDTPVDLSEIGGLRRLKRWLAERETALTDAGREYGLAAPRGVLLLGIQGAGKSLCAKAVATAWQLPLLRMDVGALYDRYVGESERRLRATLEQAEAMAPLVLWVDEVEKAFASAASRSTDGGLSQRMFGTLLTWMQERTSPAFLVATANDIEALPPELLRKGRFDEIFFVDLPDAKVRRDIFAIHLRKRQRAPAAFDLTALAKAADGFSGAEIEQAVIAGMHAAFAVKKNLSTEHILEAVRTSPPLSVTMAERVAALREWADGRCVPAD
ncbi:MAG: AAA family ATPase [Phycisphaerae bacterium]|jgi:SpoVK/Ycf46/Vps4 family AAA+-type ATPase